MTSPADIQHMLRTRPREHSLPQAFYNDPALFRMDMEAIFHRHWICVGAEGEVRAPGQFITLSIGESPIIVLRDQAGTVRAFHNTCRHRGSRILDAACGTTKGLVCPYHRWTYRLDGSLAWAQYMPDSFDKAEHGLIPIHVRLLGGTVYVCLADDPPDFDTYARGMEPLLAPHGLGDAKVALEERIVVDGNWKLMMENSRECYHCAAQHRPLMKYFLDIYDFKNPEDNALISAFWRRMEADGIPCAIAEGIDHRATRLPFTNGAVSTTADGQPAVAKRLGRVPHNDVGSLRWVHYPSVFNHGAGRLRGDGPHAAADAHHHGGVHQVAGERRRGRGGGLRHPAAARDLERDERRGRRAGGTQPGGGELDGVSPGAVFAGTGGGGDQVRRLVLRQAGPAPGRRAPAGGRCVNVGVCRSESTA